ncbi:MAG: TlpA family protein disulfide reductase [Deltaproteobacteria bacterium]|nr:TlpA family protein disulfide reductase [Deltaproteobacteria bacterium]
MRALTAVDLRLLGRVLGLVVALGVSASAASADVLAVGDRAAELDVAVDASGKPVKLKAFKGRWVLLTAGAAWCVPCKKELPAWDKVAGELKDKITFVALTLDNDIADGKRFHKKLGLKNMVIVYLPEEKSGVAARYGAATMPSSFVVDPQGIVRHVHLGFDERNASGEQKKLKAALAKLIQ